MCRRMKQVLESAKSVDMCDSVKWEADVRRSRGDTITVLFPGLWRASRNLMYPTHGLIPPFLCLDTVPLALNCNEVALKIMHPQALELLLDITLIL